MRRAAVLSLVALMSLATVACRGGGVTNAARTQTPPAAPAADPNGFTGTVAETMNAGGYTYVRLQAPGKDDVWAAAREFSTKAGDRLTVTLSMPMENFESKTLKRTFPLVYFVPDVTRDGERIVGEPVAGDGGTPALMASHAPAAVATTVEPLAPPADGLSIAEVWAKRSALGGRQVTVRGKVVKVNPQILRRNWIHLQDGSGSAGDGTNDLTLTTEESVKVGDVITVTGVLAIDKDFGAGYKYAAIVEGVKLVK